jgi:hypothetical protein
MTANNTSEQTVTYRGLLVLAKGCVLGESHGSGDRPLNSVVSRHQVSRCRLLLIVAR